MKQPRKEDLERIAAKAEAAGFKLVGKYVIRSDQYVYQFSLNGLSISPHSLANIEWVLDLMLARNGKRRQ